MLAESIDESRWGSVPMRREKAPMADLVRRLVREDFGQDMAEYGIALAVIGVVAGLAAFAIANNVGSLWSRANSLISTAVG